MIDKGVRWAIIYILFPGVTLSILEPRDSSQDSPEEELRNHSTLRKHHLLLFLCDNRLLLLLLYLWNVCLSMIDWSKPVVRNPSVYQSISPWLIYTMLMPVHAETCIWLAIEPRQWTMIGCTVKASLWTRVFQNYHWIVLVLTYYNSVARVESVLPLPPPGPHIPISLDCI